MRTNETSCMLLAVLLLVAGGLHYTAAMSMQSYTEQGDCQSDQLCQYNFAVEQKLFQDKENTFTVQASVQVACHSVGVFNGSMATQYCMTVTDTEFGGAMYANTSEQQREGQQQMTNVLLSGWFCFVQSENGKVVAVYHASGENPVTLNFKKTIAAAFQANFQGTEEEEEQDPQSMHMSHYQYSETGEEGMTIMRRRVVTEDVMDYPAGVARDDVQLVTDEEIEYRSGTLYHSSGNTSVRIDGPSNQTQSRQESIIDFQAFSASGSYSLDLQRCYSLSQTVHSRKRRSLEEEIERDFEEDSLKATMDEVKMAQDEMEQLREQIPSVTATLQQIHEDPTSVGALERLLVLEAQYGPLPQHTPALSDVTDYLFKSMESQEPQDVEMRIVIYSLLSAEGSLQSQMILLNELTNAPTEDERSAISTQIAFIKHPHKIFVAGIEDILNNNVTEGLLLSYGALASEASPAMQSRIVVFLLNHHTTATSQNVTDALTYLIYALGNTGAQQALPTLIGYLNYPVVDVKLVAISSLRRFTQNQKVQDAFEQLLVREANDQLVGAIAEVLVEGLEYSQPSGHKAIEPSDDFISVLVSATLLYNSTDLHELVASYLDRLTSEMAETELQRLQDSRLSEKRSKRGTTWNEYNSVYNLVASQSSRNADVANYGTNIAYIWGDKLGVDEVNVQFAAGTFMGISNDCDNMKAYAKVAAEGKLFHGRAIGSEVEALVEKQGSRVQSRFTLRNAGYTLLSDNVPGYASSSCFFRHRVGVSSSSRNIIDITRNVYYIYAGSITFYASMRTQVSGRFSFAVCPNPSSVHGITHNGISADFTAVLYGRAGGTLMDFSQAGIRLNGSISYVIGPGGDADWCDSTCTSVFRHKICGDIRRRSPSNFIDLYAWYKQRTVEQCYATNRHGQRYSYGCNVQFGPETRLDSFSRRWDRPAMRQNTVFDSCDGYYSGYTCY